MEGEIRKGVVRAAADLPYALPPGVDGRVFDIAEKASGFDHPEECDDGCWAVSVTRRTEVIDGEVCLVFEVRA